MRAPAFYWIYSSILNCNSSYHILCSFWFGSPMFLFLLLLFLFILRLAYSIWREVRFEWSESPYAANESDEWRTLIETLNFSSSSSSFFAVDSVGCFFLSLDLLHLVENRLVHVLCKVENVIQIHKFGNGMQVLHLIAFAYQKKNPLNHTVAMTTLRHGIAWMICDATVVCESSLTWSKNWPLIFG